MIGVNILRRPKPMKVLRVGLIGDYNAAVTAHQAIPRALELAPRAVPAGTGSHADQLWLAEVYQKVGRLIEATQILERLVEQYPDVREVWIALVQQLVRSRQRERADC